MFCITEFQNQQNYETKPKEHDDGGADIGTMHHESRNQYR